jgi:hypothetical protein
MEWGPTCEVGVTAIKFFHLFLTNIEGFQSQNVCLGHKLLHLKFSLLTINSVCEESLPFSKRLKFLRIVSQRVKETRNCDYMCESGREKPNAKNSK